MKALRHIVLLAGLAVTLLPFAWMLSTSLKPADQLFTVPPTWLPRELAWDTYARAMGAGNFNDALYVEVEGFSQNNIGTAVPSVAPPINGLKYVSTGPGATALTRTPEAAPSSAAAFVSPSTACLLAVYTDAPAAPLWPTL